jgi:hypothetical protein
MTDEARAQILNLSTDTQTIAHYNNKRQHIDTLDTPKEKLLRKNSVSLKEACPEIAAQWHPTKNRNITPADVSKGSGLIVWWLCPQGHTWDATVNSRTSRNAGCPYCSNHIVLPGYNDLATTHPDLAAQWHPTKNGNLKPTNITAGSNREVWWQCEKGHEWKARTSDRVTKEIGCPVCSNRQVLVGYNDLATTHPELAAQWHPTKNHKTPQEYTCGSSKTVWWKCEKGHEWKAKIADRYHGDGCPYCGNKKVLIGFNDLATTHPELAAQWHSTKNGNLKPTDVVAGSNREVWWQCAHGHEWSATVASRTSGRGCPQCSNQTSFNEQALFYYTKQMCPDARNRVKIAGKEADIWVPSLHAVEEYDGWWHNEAKIQNDVNKALHMQENGMHFIRIREPSCPILPETIGEIFLLLSTKRNDVEMAIRWSLQQLHSLNPTLIMPSVDLARDEVIIQSQLTRHKQERSLGYLYPELCAEWDWEKNGNLTPYMVTPKSNKKVFWKCTNGHSYKTSPYNRVRSENSCPYCNRSGFVPGYNDLSTTNPELAKYWHPTKNGNLTPADVSAGSGQKVWWLCDCGHEYYKAPCHQKHGQCNTCYTHKVRCGINDLATTHPQLLDAWCFDLNLILPTQVTAKNHYMAAWRCKHGHVHYQTVARYVKSPQCPHCVKQDENYNDKGKKCAVKHIDGEIVKYDSVLKAAIANGCSQTTIRNYCNQKYFPPDRGQWFWLTEEKVYIIATNLLNGMEYAFETTAAAAKDLGCDASNISKCLRGKSRQTKGYSFRYSSS